MKQKFSSRCRCYSEIQSISGLPGIQVKSQSNFCIRNVAKFYVLNACNFRKQGKYSTTFLLLLSERSVHACTLIFIILSRVKIINDIALSILYTKLYFKMSISKKKFEGFSLLAYSFVLFCFIFFTSLLDALLAHFVLDIIWRIFICRSA